MKLPEFQRLIERYLMKVVESCVYAAAMSWIELPNEMTENFEIRK